MARVHTMTPRERTLLLCEVTSTICGFGQAGGCGQEVRDGEQFTCEGIDRPIYHPRCYYFVLRARQCELAGELDRLAVEMGEILSQTAAPRMPGLPIARASDSGWRYPEGMND